MRSLAIFALTAIAVALFGHPAKAGKRVALVIGNSDYQHVARLPNPDNDAAAMESTFRAAGFDLVDSRRDLNAADMRRALREFADKSRESDVAVIYFAGHGIEVDGTNYLVPVDATLERDTDVYDEAFSLDRVLLAIEPAKKLRLVILDACRENPFSRLMKRTIGSREITRGLARVEPARPNTLVAYAAKAGSTAADGNGKNSPFTTALVKHIVTPGLDLRKAFGFVRDEVLAETSNRQEPFLFGSLGGEDIPLVPAKPVVAAADQVTPSYAQADVSRAFDLALQLGTKDGWAAFLAHYSEGFYADLAKAQLAKVAANEQHVTENAPVVEHKNELLSPAEKLTAASQAAQPDRALSSTAEGANSVLAGEACDSVCRARCEQNAGNRTVDNCIRLWSCIITKHRGNEAKYVNKPVPQDCKAAEAPKKQELEGLKPQVSSTKPEQTSIVDANSNATKRKTASKDISGAVEACDSGCRARCQQNPGNRTVEKCIRLWSCIITKHRGEEAQFSNTKKPVPQDCQYVLRSQ